MTSIGSSYAAMFRHAADHGIRLGQLKLDVGYQPDGQEATHDLYVLLED